MRIRLAQEYRLFLIIYIRYEFFMVVYMCRGEEYIYVDIEDHRGIQANTETKAEKSLSCVAVWAAEYIFECRVGSTFYCPGCERESLRTIQFSGSLHYYKFLSRLLHIQTEISYNFTFFVFVFRQTDLKLWTTIMSYRYFKFLLKFSISMLKNQYWEVMDLYQGCSTYKSLRVPVLNNSWYESWYDLKI